MINAEEVVGWDVFLRTLKTCSVSVIFIFPLWSVEFITNISLNAFSTVLVAVADVNFWLYSIYPLFSGAILFPVNKFVTFIGDFKDVNVALINVKISKDLIGYKVWDIFWKIFDSIPDTSELAVKLTVGKLVKLVSSVELVFTKTSTAKTADVKSMSVNVNFFWVLINLAICIVCKFSSKGGETSKSRNDFGLSLVTVVLPSATLKINSVFSL